MNLSFEVPLLYLLPCLTVAAFLAIWVYTRTVPSLHNPKRIALTALRFSSLLTILFLLFRPILQNIVQTERPPVMAVLIDDSQSLTLHTTQDGEPAQGVDSLGAPRLMDQVLDAFPDEGIPGDLEFYRFSSSTLPISSTPPNPDSIPYIGERTNIAQALDFVRNDLDDQNLKGVLILSDGQFNTGRNPLYVAERYPVPIYTVVVGDTTRKRDLQIRRITTNDFAYIGDALPVQVTLLSEDYGGERVTVTLFDAGTILQTSTVELPEGISETTVDMEHVPEAAGLQRYTVSVSRLAGEATTRNNTRSVAVRVIENKKRYLLLAAAPDPDVSATMQLLAEDKNVQVDAYVQKTSNTFYNEEPLDSLDVYDAAILIGYPGRNADAATSRRVAAAIRDGLPAFFMYTTQTDLRILKDQYADVLPVQPRVIRTNVVESVLTPSVEGLRHPLFQIPDLSPPLWSLLPPLAHNDSRWVALPTARVLATQKIRGIQLDTPLLAVQNINRQRTAALLGSGTWRWKNLPEDLEPAGPIWPTLFSNTLQWITTLEDDRPVRVSPVEDLFSGDTPILFDGQVYDESLNPVDGATVEIDVLAGDSIRYPYIMEPVGNGRYMLDIGVLPEGNYQYTARAGKNDVTLGNDQGSFAVGSLTIEFQETRADGALMRALSQRSGGTSFATSDVAEIPAYLRSTESFRSIFFEERIETELWQRHFFLILIIVLLTTEWFVRKRSGMV